MKKNQYKYYPIRVKHQAELIPVVMHIWISIFFK